MAGIYRTDLTNASRVLERNVWGYSQAKVPTESQSSRHLYERYVSVSLSLWETDFNKRTFISFNAERLFKKNKPIVPPKVSDSSLTFDLLTREELRSFVSLARHAKIAESKNC